MPSYRKSARLTSILEHAQTLGASLAGVARIASLREAPSYQQYAPRAFPEEMNSVLVLALRHEEDEPELDWWGPQVQGGTPGNQRLREMAEALAQWLQRTYAIQAQPLAYYVDTVGELLQEKGGTFLKDAAVLAGLGVMGDNNLLITPEFGPRVRLRALFLDHAFEPPDPLTFSPCDACDHPCQAACPQQAFVFGTYSRELCARQMHIDEANSVMIPSASTGTPQQRITYCRACEFACPVGR
ncbi:epoxyqueuosine reductase [candidate division KSB3 bacterium]|uniref:Epoxyqueuosine reductase n=1 Tax=candidate division KSB3 bacterium TaxID=2044937 RepID=A0A9D5JT38_9BACT|nr:epoxyqueuosine reductase [candidate division KSB3 bacterium]MBD3323482.1 epoxyqueuosine reductase [candidate division KSB3 bacterium]